MLDEVVAGGFSGSSTWLRLAVPESPQAGMPASPFIVRMAGLTGDSLAAFASPACLTCLESLRQLLSALAEARAQLVNTLAEMLPRQSPDLRRFILSIKRDSFNGRSLGRSNSQTEWEKVD